MSRPATKLLDCRGMQCPTPILHIATAARSSGSVPTVLEVLVDDQDFPKDVEAWCRTSKSRLIGMEESGGVIRARIGLNGADPQIQSGEMRRVVIPEVESANDAPPSKNGARLHELDCRGMRCPAPILALSKFARSLGSPSGIIEVTADDAEFPSDLRAWCKTTGAQILDISHVANNITARLALGGRHAPTTTPPATPPTPPDALSRITGVTPSHPGQRPPSPPGPYGGAHVSPTATAGQQRPSRVDRRVEAIPPKDLAPRPPLQAPAATFDPIAPLVAQQAPGQLSLDLRGMRAPQPVLQLSSALASHAGARVTAIADDPGFLADVMAWSTATRVTVLRAEQEAGVTQVSLQLGAAPLTESHPVSSLLSPQPMPASSLAGAQVAPLALSPLALSPVAPPQDIQVTVPQAQEDRCTILIIRNDFESLMAAMLCATTAAAQGLEAVMYFSFWGVNVLRGERPRAREPRGRVSLLQRVMKWMMPKGPSRQKMSKMHMGGMGKGMMQYFMRKNNVMSLESMIQSAVDQNVRFVVCTMSMGIMGIEKRDLLDLPNIEYAGVTSFVELSQRSKSTLVF